MKTKSIFHFILLGLMLTTLALACKPRTTLSNLRMTTYSYLDAIGNMYLLNQDSLAYVPMTPERSSSGMADGGDPKTVAINSGAFQTLQEQFDAALSDKEHQIKNRIMGCGTVGAETDGKSRVVFMDANAATKLALETALKTKLR